MTQAWDQVQYPSYPFMPPGSPSAWFNPLWMGAIAQANQQTQAMPVLPEEYVYWLPSVFFQGEPSNQVNPVYYEAWQNQATMLMPVYPSEELSGSPHLWPSFFQVISRPVFLPDGTGVTSPTKAKPVHPGRDDLTIAPL